MHEHQTTPSPFAGSVPQNYHTRLVPILFEDYADDLTQRIAATNPAAVLETAAGTGVVSQRLRKALPDHTSLTVTDFSPHMLAVAADHLAAAPNTTFQQADATALPFEDSIFDAVACQFGVMFFPDEPLGYREAARVLKPAGRFVFNVWDDMTRNPIAKLIHETLGMLAPNDPPMFFETPFRDLDATGIIRDLQAAGFDRVNIAVLEKPCRVRSATAAVEAYINSSPLGPQVEKRGLTETGGNACIAALAQAFADGDPNKPIEVPMQAVVFEVHKPE